MRSPRMRAHLGMISLFAVALTLLTGAAWGETPTTGKPAPSAKMKASACDRHAFRAVIDVGHTLTVGGATSARGIYEYEFNLRLAKQIANKLTSAGFDKTVLLITTEPAHSALFRRSSRANAMGADLFLSIHHDSVPDPMLEKWTYDGAEHAYNDRFPGHSIFISNDNPQRGRSPEFASVLGAQLKARDALVSSAAMIWLSRVRDSAHRQRRGSGSRRSPFPLCSFRAHPLPTECCWPGPPS